MMINSRKSLGVPPIPQMGVEWAELPEEIIELISKRLTIYADYLRFRCVCRTWNSSVPKIPLHLPPQLPWLLLTPNSFCDLSTHKIHLLSIPLSSSNYICGSSFGWLVILDQIFEVRLFNPITRRTLFLPPLNTLPGFFRTTLYYSNSQILNKVVLSSRPSLSDDFAAFAVLNSNVLAFCRKGYDSWVPLNVNGNHLWMDVVFKNGLFYAVSTRGVLAVCDVEGPRVSIIETTISVNLWKEAYYVVFFGEDMLLVSWYLLKKDVSETKRFPILKMNWNTLKWEEIQTLGNKMLLFVGWRSSVSFSDSDIAGGCPPNRIYFINNDLRKDDLGIFSLSEKRIELLARYPLFSERRLGFPVWVTPNPR